MLDRSAIVEAMRYSVLLVPDADGRLAVSVPALPGCVSMGDSRNEALEHVREAIAGWLETEDEAGRPPPTETPAVIAAGVAQALEIIDEMREAGELPPDFGYQLTVATIDVHPAVTV